MLCQYSRTAQPHALTASLATLPLLFASSAWAAPLAKRGGESTSNKIIAPVIVVVVFVIAIPVLFYRKEVFSQLRNISFFSLLVPHQPPTTVQVRDLTAEEIAGTTATAEAQAAAAARTERRARRTRRTPSQISTRSLPAYMKEPGELELVIIQGSDDMEDAPLTTQVVMPPVTEDEDESVNSHSRNISQASSYVIVNDDSHVQTPLLEIEHSNDSNHELENPNAHVSPGTVDISDVQDNNGHIPNSPEPPDPRGEAPPYFEVVGDLEAVRATSGELSRVETTDTLPMAPDVESAMEIPHVIPETRRRSMFRGLISAASRALSSPPTYPQPPTTSRLSRDVLASPRPSNLSARPAGSRSPRVGHRPTTSHSGSVLSVTSSAFGRVTSRSRSTSNVGALTSPSMISIGSISAPLAHTAVRTDFVYPRSGPTPEQLKLISSVESVSKFGVPYGPAAVAYASASRVNLQAPPPEFEERSSLDGLPGSSEAATRARSRSALSRGSEEENRRDSRSSGSSLPPPPAESTAAPRPVSTTASDPAISTSLPDPDTFDDKKEQLVDPVEDVPPRPPSPSPTVATASTAATVTKATTPSLNAVTETTDDIIASSSHRPALPSFDLAAAATRKPIAPSSFRMPSTPLGGVRPGSRASSVDTFQTAASHPDQGQRGDEAVMSDTELETDTFTDAESGAEAESETPTLTPLAITPAVGSIPLAPAPHVLSV